MTFFNGYLPLYCNYHNNIFNILVINIIFIIIFTILLLLIKGDALKVHGVGIV